MFSKYQYLIREKIYQGLKLLPDFMISSLLDIYVDLEKKKLDTLQTPLSLILYVTNKCNARCSHCFYWQELNQSNDDLSLEELNKIASSLKHPLNTLSITGGEPFLRNDIVEIVKVFVEKNKTKKINIASNGFFTDKIVLAVENILKNNNDLDLNVQISLDGECQTHNQIRGIEIFDKAIKSIGALEKVQEKYKNFHVTVQTTISKINFSEIAKFRDFVKKQFPAVHHGFQFTRSAKFDTYGISQNCLAGFDPKEEETSSLSLDQMKEAVRDGVFYEDRNNSLLNNYIKIMNEGIINTKQNKKRFVRCLAGTYDGVIYANGDVTMCEFTKSFANLRDFNFNFYDLWQGELAQKRRQDIKTCFCNHTCNIMNAMRFDRNVLLKIIKYK